jgi:hypothetical protein
MAMCGGSGATFTGAGFRKQKPKVPVSNKIFILKIVWPPICILLWQLFNSTNPSKALHDATGSDQEVSTSVAK